jgi:hypothetical protein
LPWFILIWSAKSGATDWFPQLIQLWKYSMTTHFLFLALFSYFLVKICEQVKILNLSVVNLFYFTLFLHCVDCLYLFVLL